MSRELRTDGYLLLTVHRDECLNLPPVKLLAIWRCLNRRLRQLYFLNVLARNDVYWRLGQWADVLPILPRRRLTPPEHLQDATRCVIVLAVVFLL